MTTPLSIHDVLIDFDGHRVLRGGVEQPLEPKAFAVLSLMASAPGRVFARDEILDAVWGHRHVSPGVLNRVMSLLRQALGEDAQAPRLLHTVHGVGYRFEAGTAPVAVETVASPAGDAPVPAGGRPSLAVLPFRTLGGGRHRTALGAAFAAELIAELSRLRWLFVIARGSSFRFAADDGDFDRIGRLLGARYCLRGLLELDEPRAAITVELVDTGDGHVVWGDRLAGPLDGLHALREEVRARTLTALELHIPLHEAALAQSRQPRDIDAWAAFHLGVRHLYRFTRSDNDAALRWFGRAVELAPKFPRAHAGLSFGHFMTAFLRHTDDVAAETSRARRCAEHAFELDPLDPFVNLALGRSFWLEGDLESGLAWLERTTGLSPNYAQAVYSRAFVEALHGQAHGAKQHADLAMRLSPLDPLYYGMQGTHAFAHLALGEDREAAAWAARAARSPGAHELISMNAAVTALLAGDAPAAARWAADVRARNPALGRDDYFRAFPMRVDAARRRVEGALRRLGF